MDESIWRRDLRDLSYRLSKGETLIVKMKKKDCPEVKNHLQLIGVLDPAYRDSFCHVLPNIDKFALLTDFVDAMIANTLSLERKLKSYRSKKKDGNYIYLDGGIVDKDTMQFVEDPRLSIPMEAFMECLKQEQEAEKKRTCKKCKKKKETPVKPVPEKEDKPIDSVEVLMDILYSKTPKSVKTIKRPEKYKNEKPLIIDLPKFMKKFEKEILLDIRDNLNSSNNEIIDILSQHVNWVKVSLRRFISANRSHCIICEKATSTKRFVPETRIVIE